MFFNFGLLKGYDRKLKEFVWKIRYSIDRFYLNHRMIAGNKMIIIGELLWKEKQLGLNQSDFDEGLNSFFHRMP